MAQEQMQAVLMQVLYDNTTGMVSAIGAVNSDGTFDLAATPGHSYTVYITNQEPIQ